MEFLDIRLTKNRVFCSMLFTVVSQSFLLADFKKTILFTGFKIRETGKFASIHV